MRDQLKLERQCTLIRLHASATPQMYADTISDKILCIEPCLHFYVNLN